MAREIVVEKVEKNKEMDLYDLKKIKGTPDAIFWGVCTVMGWKIGKVVSEEDYDCAVEQFKKTPICSIGGQKC